MAEIMAVSNRIRVLLRALCLSVALTPPIAVAQAPAPSSGLPAGVDPNSPLAAALGQRQTISSGVAALVNDYVISDYDLDQRVALFVATSGVRPTKETLLQIRAQVLRSLEDEVLELQEAQKHKITVSKADVDRAVKNIADDNHTTSEEIVATVRRAGATLQ